MLNPVCTICKAPAVYLEDEGIWRHKEGSIRDYIFCDKYGYPIEVEEGKDWEQHAGE